MLGKYYNREGYWAEAFSDSAKEGKMRKKKKKTDTIQLGRNLGNYC